MKHEGTCMTAELPSNTTETTTGTTGVPTPIENPGNVVSSTSDTDASAQLVASSASLPIVGTQSIAPSLPEPTTPYPELETEQTIKLTSRQQRVLRYLAR